jgi:hypothetical protein
VLDRPAGRRAVDPQPGRRATPLLGPAAVPREAGSEDRDVDHPPPASVRVEQQPHAAEVDLKLVARFAVGHPGRCCPGPGEGRTTRPRTGAASGPAPPPLGGPGASRPWSPSPRLPTTPGPDRHGPPGAATTRRDRWSGGAGPVPPPGPGTGRSAAPRRPPGPGPTRPPPPRSGEPSCDPPRPVARSSGTRTVEPDPEHLTNLEHTHLPEGHRRSPISRPVATSAPASRPTQVARAVQLLAKKRSHHWPNRRSHDWPRGDPILLAKLAALEAPA